MKKFAWIIPFAIAIGLGVWLKDFPVAFAGFTIGVLIVLLINKYDITEFLHASFPRNFVANHGKDNINEFLVEELSAGKYSLKVNPITPLDTSVKVPVFYQFSEAKVRCLDSDSLNDDYEESLHKGILKSIFPLSFGIILTLFEKSHPDPHEAMFYLKALATFAPFVISFSNFYMICLFLRKKNHRFKN